MAKSAFLDFLDNLESLGEKSLGSSPWRIVLYGEDAYLRQLYVHDLRAHARKSSSLAVIDFDKNTGDLSEVVTQDDLFSERLFYQINTKDQDGALIKFLQQMRDGHTKHHLFLQLTTKKLTEKLKKELDKQGFRIIHAAPPAPFEYAPFIQFRSKAVGLKLNQDASAAILEHYGQDLIQIDNELKRLSLIFPDKKPMTLEQLTPHLGFLREDESFRLRQYILEGKRALALCLAADLQRRGESTLAVLGFLTKHVRQSCQIASGLKEGKSPQELIQATHLHPSTFKRYTEYCRHIGLLRLRQGWKACVKADQLAKTGGLRDDLLFIDIFNLIA